MKIDYIGYALAILSLIYAYYLYRKGLRIKEPVYSIKSNNLISGSVSTLINLKITYKIHQIEDLTVSKILFYNRGAETIHQQDIQTINPLSVSSETCKILDASILQVNNPSNNISISLNEANEYIYINFDYLDKNQGAVIQVVHTGKSSDDLHVDGDIKGVQSISKTTPEKLEARKIFSTRQKMAIWIMMLLSIPGLYFLGFQKELFTTLIHSGSFFGTVLSILIIIASSFSVITLIILEDYFLKPIIEPNKVLPKGLEKFLE